MSEVEFQIPEDKDALLEANGFYYVKEICVLDQIKDNVQGAQSELTTYGPEAILNCFDTYYSIIYYEDKLDIEFLTNVLQNIVKPFQRLSNDLELLFADKVIEEETRFKNLNIIKMLFYLYSKITTSLENKIIEKNDKCLDATKKKTRIQLKSKSPDENKYKSCLLHSILQICQMPIYRFWQPPVCEEQFANLISDACFAILTNSEVKYEKNVQNYIFNIFGVLIKDYNAAMIFTVRISHLIKIKEHLSTIVPTGIKILVDDYNILGIVRELARELTEWQTEEIQDNAASKYCSLILVEMTNLIPDIMLKEVLFLLIYLKSHSYILRNCVLSIIAEIVLNNLSSENITEQNALIRDKLLSKLMDHIYDININVRAKVLQHWIRLHTESAIPKAIQIGLFKKICSRLEDKGALVRKYAIQLVITFLKCNPYSSKLDINYYKKELSSELKKASKIMSTNKANQLVTDILDKEYTWNTIKDTIKNVVSEHLDSEDESEEEFFVKSQLDVRDLIESENYKEAFLYCKRIVRKNETGLDVDEMTINKRIDFYITFMKSIYTNVDKNAEEVLVANINVMKQLTAEELDQLQNFEEAILYLEDVVAFLDIIDETVIPIMIELLDSPTMTDFNEAINFFVVANQFGIKRSTEGITAMLSQMNTNESERKYSIIDAYRTIILSYEGIPKDKNITIINRLINLIKTIRLIDLPYLSEVLLEWANKNDLDNVTINTLFSMLTGQTSCTNENRLAALQILIMIGPCKRSLIERNINVITDVVFGDISLIDPRYFIFGCNLLGLLETDLDISNKKSCFKIPLNDLMWIRITEKLLKLLKKKDPYCHAAINAVVDLVYKICRFPERMSQRIIKNVLALIKNPKSNIIAGHKIHYKTLALFLHLLGEIGIQQFIYLDGPVYKELKRRHCKDKEKEKLQKDKMRATNSLTSLNQSRQFKDLNSSEYLDIVQADDLDAEFILSICETELVTKNMLGRFVKFIIKVISERHIYRNQEVQASAILTLSRFMNISSQVCNKYLELLMMVLQKTKYPQVKNNILISIADLFHRFPNTIEPWTEDLFKIVNDKNVTVRITSISILCSLMAEDMIRVKGMISNVAICIVDKNDIIRKIVTNFFQMLSNRGNTIYNILPDIISRYSNDKQQIHQDSYDQVMAFLFDLLSKEKQVESLVAKLCARCELTSVKRIWRDIGYCLTLLNFTEKSLLRLVENFKSYKICLEDDVFYELMLSIVNKYKTCGSDEIKTIVRTLEHIIRTGESEENDFMFEYTQSQTLTQTSQRKKKLPNSGRSKRNKCSSSQNYNEESE